MNRDSGPISNASQAMEHVMEMTRQARFVEARAAVDALAAALPGETPVINAQGWVAVNEGRFDEAIHCYERAIAIAPDDAVSHYNLALCLLLTGQLERGWREFEWRMRIEHLKYHRSLPQPQWMGQDARGRTILCHASRGHGDAIQFSRYLPELARRGARVLLECDAGLVPLLARLPGVAAVFARGAALPSFDLHCPLPSLPLAFGTILDTIPADIPYLNAPEDKVDHWKRRLGSARGPRVGLCWAGAPLDVDHRSRTLATFAPLAGASGVEIHSLQVGDDARQWPPPGLRVIDHGRELTDFTDTAALVMNLDLVLTVDTSIAHLAGALGKPVWVMVHRIPDFRWMVDRPDSPWYPTMRLFRQPRHSTDYAPVAAAMAVALRKM